MPMPVPVDKDCLFCKMVTGQVPCTKVHEDDFVLAFMDINPVSRGHTLVIPKGHWANLLELPDGLGEPLLAALRDVARAVTLEAGAKGFNIVQNNNPAAGQVIFHFHWHIIPRFENDGLALWAGTRCTDFDALSAFANSANKRIIRSGGAHE